MSHTNNSAIVCVATACLAVSALYMPFHCASAQTRAETFATLENWGLIGHWAIDCSKPAAADNARHHYGVVSSELAGVPFFHIDRGHDSHRMAILAAIVTPEGYLRLDLGQPNGTPTRTMTMRLASDKTKYRYNRWELVGSKSEVVIANDTFVKGGVPTKWYGKCDSKPVS